MSQDIVCISCKKPSIVLHRTNQFKSEDPGWMCPTCLKKNEPELFECMTEADKQLVSIIARSVVNKITSKR